MPLAFTASISVYIISQFVFVMMLRFPSCQTGTELLYIILISLKLQNMTQVNIADWQKKEGGEIRLCFTHY
jgi:hypothetical protein